MQSRSESPHMQIASNFQRGLFAPTPDEYEQLEMTMPEINYEAIEQQMLGTISMNTRIRLREKQDHLLDLLGDRFPTHFRIADDFPGSPTIGQLRHTIWPEWEAAIDHAIRQQER